MSLEQIVKGLGSLFPQSHVSLKKKNLLKYSCIVENTDNRKENGKQSSHH